LAAKQLADAMGGRTFSQLIALYLLWRLVSNTPVGVLLLLPVRAFVTANFI